MTADEYRTVIAKLGLSQVGAAKMLGVNERTSRRWARGEYQIPRWVELTLALMLRLDNKKRRRP